MEIFIILPFVLLALAVPKGIVWTVFIVSCVLCFTPLEPFAMPVAGGSFFVLVIKHFIG